MNLYVVVEGRSGEKKVYPKWIAQLNPALTQVYSIADLQRNNYILVSGNGYPQYFTVIDNAVEDCKVHPEIDYLVIAIDAEDLSYGERRDQIIRYVEGRLTLGRVRIVVQHPCLEAWALGNRKVVRKNPQDPVLRKFLSLYDVRSLDPEGLPDYPEGDLNRAQFAYIYLRKVLGDRYQRLSYSKRNPAVIEHPGYFMEIQSRQMDTHHISSFKGFVDAFSREEGAT